MKAAVLEMPNPPTPSAPPAPEPFVSAEKAALHLGGISEKTVRNLAAAGRIPAYNYGTEKKALWRFKLSELDAQAPKAKAQ